METFQKNYIKGVSYFIASLIISSLNDVITKHMGLNMPVAEVVFFRFLFSALLLLPWTLFKGLKTFRTKFPIIHFLRSLILFLAISLWTLSLVNSNIVVATMISFTIPLFVVILAAFFLKERIGLSKWLATISGFIGIIIILNIKSFNKIHLADYSLLFAAICFALLDIINKKYIVQESMFNMMFYSSLFVIILALPQTVSYWITPNFKQIICLITLGAGANFLLYFILEAYKRVDASTLAPFRYIELLISSFFAYIFFNEFPSQSLLKGAIFIIPSSLFILYRDSKKLK